MPNVKGQSEPGHQQAFEEPLRSESEDNMGISDHASPLLGAENPARQVPRGQTDSPPIVQTTPESTSAPTEPSSRRTSTYSEEWTSLSPKRLHLDTAEDQGSGKDGKSEAAESVFNCGGQVSSMQPDVAQRNGRDQRLTSTESVTSDADMGRNVHTVLPLAKVNDTYAFKVEEQRWRRRMYRVFRATDYKHRHAVSSALACLRRSPQWLCADLEEKIKQNQAQIARVGIRYTAKSSQASDKDDHTYNANLRPLKRKWVRRMASHSSQSTVTPDRGATDAGRSKSAA